MKSTMGHTRGTEEEVDTIVEEVLNEDQDEDFDATGSGSCPGGCDQSDNVPKEISRQCKCGVENSSRFSLRVMEALRLLQREVDQPSTSTVEDIVDYISANYRSDGDLYAQVRTALRQVCSQGFVVELLDNEYHLIGPIASSMNRRRCSFDCEARGSTTIDGTYGRRRGINNHKDGMCRCGRFPKGNGPPHRRRRAPREESRRETFTVDSPEDFAAGAILHSTGKSADEEALCDCEGTSDVRGDRRQRDDDTIRIREIERVSPIAGPSRTLTRAPSPIPAKKARVEDRRVQLADEENDEESTTDSDMVEVHRDTYPRSRPPDRTPRIERKKRDREDDEGDEEVAEMNDEDTDDSAYRELRRRSPRRRPAARERELKRWIRRCRQECERRRPR